MDDFFCLFDCVATNVGGGEIWTVGNASHPEITRAWTKRNTDQLATNKIVKLKPSSKPGNLPLIWEISAEAQPDSFGRACRDNCATAQAMAEDLEWSNPDDLLTHKQVVEILEVMQAQMLRVMSLLR